MSFSFKELKNLEVFKSLFLKIRFSPPLQILFSLIRLYPLIFSCWWVPLAGCYFSFLVLLDLDWLLQNALNPAILTGTAVSSPVGLWSRNLQSILAEAMSPVSLPSPLLAFWGSRGNLARLFCGQGCPFPAGCGQFSNIVAWLFPLVQD